MLITNRFIRAFLKITRDGLLLLKTGDESAVFANKGLGLLSLMWFTAVRSKKICKTCLGRVVLKHGLDGSSLEWAFLGAPKKTTTYHHHPPGIRGR